MLFRSEGRFQLRLSDDLAEGVAELLEVHEGRAGGTLAGAGPDLEGAGAELGPPVLGLGGEDRQNAEEHQAAHFTAIIPQPGGSVAAAAGGGCGGLPETAALAEAGALAEAAGPVLAVLAAGPVRRRADLAAA